jgi:hypothetical protein
LQGRSVRKHTPSERGRTTPIVWSIAARDGKRTPDAVSVRLFLAIVADHHNLLLHSDHLVPRSAGAYAHRCRSTHGEALLSCGMAPDWFAPPSPSTNRDGRTVADWSTAWPIVELERGVRFQKVQVEPRKIKGGARPNATQLPAVCARRHCRSCVDLFSPTRGVFAL